MNGIMKLPTSNQPVDSHGLFDVNDVVWLDVVIRM